jgi:hypothetical protein
VPAGFYSAAWTEGITVLELFGGLCAGLEMALRNGCKVARYIYADTDSAARRVAAHRVQALDQRYPGQLAADACAYMFITVPQDVRHVSRHSGACGGRSRQGRLVAGGGRLAM